MSASAQVIPNRFAMSVAAAPVKTRAPTNKWLVTVSVTFGTLMGAIDSSIVNVAINHIRGTVGATLEEITWISTAFVIATVLVMPLTAFLGRQFGQKRVYMSCLVLFLVGSFLCGLSQSLTQLIIFRAIQGFGAGALQPTEQAILRQTFSKKEQGMAMALFAMAVMIGPAVGPTLGGYIVDNFSWPWIFYINMPVGALGLFMVSRFVHEDEDIRKTNMAQAERERKNLDWQGITLLSVGLSTLQYVLEEGNAKDWFESRLIVFCALTALFSLTAFVARELTAKAPVVNLSLFKDPVFLSGTAIGSMMFAMLMANMFLLPVFMQSLLGFTAMQSGMALIPRVLVMMVATPVVGRFYNKVSARVTIGFGIVMFAIGAFQMSHFTLQTSEANIISAIIVQGIGFSCLFVPLTTVALAEVPRHLMTDATGLNSLFRQIGGSMGLAVFATLLSRYGTIAKASISAHLTLARPDVAARVSQMQGAMIAGGVDPVAAKTMSIMQMAGIASQQATVMSFEKLFLLSGFLFLGIMPVLFFLKEKPEQAAGPKAEVHLDI